MMSIKPMTENERMVWAASYVQELGLKRTPVEAAERAADVVTELRDTIQVVAQGFGSQTPVFRRIRQMARDPE